MIYAMVEYVNKNGNLTVKGFPSKAKTDSFINSLEKRNVRYILTVL